MLKQFREFAVRGSVVDLRASATSRVSRWWDRLQEPVDIASLVYFRITFGLILLWEIWRYFDHGWIRRYYVEPVFFFKYYGFGWIEAWPGVGMYLHFLALGVLALCIAAGLWYRWAAPLFFLGFAYVFLLDQTNYLNHFYLITLLSFLMIFVPAHRALSLDVRRRPELRSDTAPAWALWALRAQIGIVYFYGGLAKLNGDWLRGEPMRMWLASRTGVPILGPWLTEEWVVYLFTYGGLFLDLLIVPLLLWRRTRAYAFAVAALFHLLNAVLFRIGIFPWLALAATALFFPPDWPRRLVARLRPGAAAASGRLAAAPGARRKWVGGLLALYFTWQLLFPLRHWWYPGNVNWTEEGHLYSWHMKLRDKHSEAVFIVTDPASRTTWEIDGAGFLTRRQVAKMASRPDMILQFAHWIAELLEGDGYEAEVRARVLVSLNGRRPQLLIDPETDLAAQPRDGRPARWIVPLREPLPRSAAERKAAVPAGLEEADDQWDP